MFNDWRIKYNPEANMPANPVPELHPVIQSLGNFLINDIITDSPIDCVAPKTKADATHI